MPLIEELDTKKHIPSPGYAYVPDITHLPKIVTNAVVPTGRNRAARNVANNANASAHESSAKQDAKVLRRLAELDRDNGRDVGVVVKGGGKSSHGKVSSNVRKILSSLKTFANYLSDAEAEAALKASQPQSSITTTTTHSAPATPVVRVPPGIVPIYGPHLTSKGTRSHKKKVPLNFANLPANSTPLRRVSTATAAASNAATSSSQIQKPKQEDADGDTAMTDTLPQKGHLDLTPVNPEIPSHPRDDDPLLVSRIPPLPTQAELDKLLAAPPLSYNEARAKIPDGEKRPPPRIFCEICGYWGRARCVKCGGRVCGVECLGVHEEYSCVKFYA